MMDRILVLLDTIIRQGEITVPDINEAYRLTQLIREQNNALRQEAPTEPRVIRAVG